MLKIALIFLPQGSSGFVQLALDAQAGPHIQHYLLNLTCLTWN